MGVRSSNKAKKDEKAQRNKLKNAIEKGNTEGARIYAANAIREKNQSLAYLKLSSRIDGVAARVQTAINMHQLTRSMGKVVKGMSAALKSMQPEKISAVLDKFEQQFEDLDVTSAYMEESMGNSSALTTPEEQVEGLMREVADEHNLEFSLDVPTAPGGRVANPVLPQAQTT